MCTFWYWMQFSTQLVPQYQRYIIFSFVIHHQTCIHARFRLSNNIILQTIYELGCVHAHEIHHDSVYHLIAFYHKKEGLEENMLKLSFSDCWLFYIIGHKIALPPFKLGWFDMILWALDTTRLILCPSSPAFPFPLSASLHTIISLSILVWVKWNL